MVTKKERGKLIQRIEHIFGQNSYPGDDKIVLQTDIYSQEREEVAEAFKGQLWQDLSLETLRYHHAAVYDFSPEGYHYYLPAYLRVGVRDYSRADLIPDFVCGSLLLSTEKRRRKTTLQRFALFSHEEKTIIHDFLHLLKLWQPDDNRPHRALNRYWYQFSE